MRALILAGGTGSRLAPLTDAVNKHLLPVGDEPMLFRGVRQLVEAGISEILVVTGPDHLGAIGAALADGSRFDAHISYRVQARPGGIAQALGLARAFAGAQDLAVLLGDNVFGAPIAPHLSQFDPARDQGLVLVKEVADPKRYGVAEVVHGRVVSIEEKPALPRSNLAVLGLYVYAPQVFEIVPTLRPSARGELEISDVNRALMEQGRLRHSVYDGEWVDAGTLDSYRIANEMVRAEQCSRTELAA